MGAEAGRDTVFQRNGGGGIWATLLLGYENEPAPTATEASDLGRDAQLEGYELAGQECEQEQREVRPCFDR